LTIDLAGALRKLKPEKRRARLAARPRQEPVSAADLAGAGPLALLPDTNVYILDAAGRLPSEAAALVDRALLVHCSVCLGELAVGVANADPERAGWRTGRDHYAALFAAVPATRLLTPDAQVWTEAGLIAGTLARTQGYGKAQLKGLLADALIYLTATKAGLPVLTADRADFDIIQQLAPEGRVVGF
jgi:predicted nucleic acid-binding protein